MVGFRINWFSDAYNGLIEFCLSHSNDFQFILWHFHNSHSIDQSETFCCRICVFYPLSNIFQIVYAHSMQLCVKYFHWIQKHSKDWHNYMCWCTLLFGYNEVWLSTYNMKMAIAWEIHTQRSYSYCIVAHHTHTHSFSENFLMTKTKRIWIVPTKHSLSSNIFCLNWKPSQILFSKDT